MSSRTPLTSVVTATVALAVVSAIVAFGALVGVQAAALALAAVAVAGAVLRMALPAGRAFSVRRRAIDVTVMLGFAAALTYLGLTAALG